MILKELQFPHCCSSSCPCFYSIYIDGLLMCLVPKIRLLNVSQITKLGLHVVDTVSSRGLKHHQHIIMQTSVNR